VGVAQADDTNDVAWRSSGHMLYCLDSRVFHQGSGSNHPCGDRKVCSGDCLRVVLDCTRRTLAFGVNSEKPLVLFRDLAPAAYVPAVDLRDCGDKVRILSSNPHVRGSAASWPSRSSGQQQRQPQRPQPQQPLQEAPQAPAVAFTEGPSASGVPPAPPEPPEAAPPWPEATDRPGTGSSSTWAPPADPLPPGSSSRRLGWETEPTAPPHPAPALPHAAHPPHPPHGSPGVQGSHPHPATSGSAQGSHPHTATGGSSTRTLQPRQSQGPQGGVPPAIAPNVAEQREEEVPETSAT